MKLRTERRFKRQRRNFFGHRVVNRWNLSIDIIMRKKHSTKRLSFPMFIVSRGHRGLQLFCIWHFVFLSSEK